VNEPRYLTRSRQNPPVIVQSFVFYTPPSCFTGFSCFSVYCCVL